MFHINAILQYPLKNFIHFCSIPLMLVKTENLTQIRISKFLSCHSMFKKFGRKNCQQDCHAEIAYKCIQSHSFEQDKSNDNN